MARLSGAEGGREAVVPRDAVVGGGVEGAQAEERGAARGGGAVVAGRGGGGAVFWRRDERVGGPRDDDRGGPARLLRRGSRLLRAVQRELRRGGRLGGGSRGRGRDAGLGGLSPSRPEPLVRLQGATRAAQRGESGGLAHRRRRGDDDDDDSGRGRPRGGEAGASAAGARRGARAGADPARRRDLLARALVDGRRLGVGRSRRAARARRVRVLLGPSRLGRRGQLGEVVLRSDAAKRRRHAARLRHDPVRPGRRERRRRRRRRPLLELRRLSPPRVDLGPVDRVRRGLVRGRHRRLLSRSRKRHARLHPERPAPRRRLRLVAQGSRLRRDLQPRGRRVPRARPDQAPSRRLFPARPRPSRTAGPTRRRTPRRTPTRRRPSTPRRTPTRRRPSTPRRPRRTEPGRRRASPEAARASRKKAPPRSPRAARPRRRRLRRRPRGPRPRPAQSRAHGPRLQVRRHAS
mmetsp:Transcript_3536/g.10928  ORF Transcript_3536/g.10928 Transcript_3536/m.10928 type:complete len:462 (-) Transcript_3536:114-1499(-)